jgi:nucleotide-binding universal stress UspA family protein
MNFFETGSYVAFEKTSATAPVLADELQPRGARAEGVVLALPARVPLAVEIAKALHVAPDIFVVQRYGIPGNGHKESGTTRLLAQLQKRHPDLRVMEIQKQARVGRSLKGSVTEALFRKNRWPVLVLRPQALDASSVGAGFRRVLYATDLSAESVPALRYASSIAKDRSTKLFVLQVETAEEGDSFEQQVALRCLCDWVQGQELEQKEASLRGARCVARFGNAAQKILETAAELKSDMIVMGAHGRGLTPGNESTFVGETAYEVACSSYCPVLIVPEPMKSNENSSIGITSEVSQPTEQAVGVENQ